MCVQNLDCSNIDSIGQKCGFNFGSISLHGTPDSDHSAKSVTQNYIYLSQTVLFVINLSISWSVGVSLFYIYLSIYLSQTVLFFIYLSMK